MLSEHIQEKGDSLGLLSEQRTLQQQVYSLCLQVWMEAFKQDFYTFMEIN